MQIIGHRGASGYKPENTIASFKEAISLGVDMIEADVHTLGSGEVVVMHDETVDRTTDGTGQVSEYTLEQLRQLDAGNGEKIPLLEEVLDAVKMRVPINIELKGAGTAQPVARIIRSYIDEKGWPHALFVVSSFNHAELQVFARMMPSIRIGLLFKDRPATYEPMFAKSLVFSANFNAEFITRQQVADAHAHGQKVFVYTVNDSTTAARMKAMKVDGIFTDVPYKMKAAIAAF